MSQQITTSEFDEKVLQASRPVLVDFYADWCGPCKAMGPVVDEVAEELSGEIDVYKLNVDENPEIAQRYRVMSIPTLIVFEGGEVKNQTLGAQPKPALLELLGK